MRKGCVCVFLPSFLPCLLLSCFSSLEYVLGVLDVLDDLDIVALWCACSQRLSTTVIYDVGKKIALAILICIVWVWVCTRITHPSWLSSFSSFPLFFSLFLPPFALKKRYVHTHAHVHQAMHLTFCSADIAGIFRRLYFTIVAACFTRSACPLNVVRRYGVRSAELCGRHGGDLWERRTQDLNGARSEEELQGLDVWIRLKFQWDVGKGKGRGSGIAVRGKIYVARFTYVLLCKLTCVSSFHWSKSTSNANV